MGFAIPWNSTCQKCNLITKGLDIFMGCKSHKGNVFRAWGIGQRQNLLFSCIIHFTFLSICTSPRVKQRRRKIKENHRETEKRRLVVQNPSTIRNGSYDSHSRRASRTFVFTTSKKLFTELTQCQSPKVTSIHLIQYTELLRILASPSGHLS